MRSSALNKLLKRPLALIAIGVILCTALISVFAYVLAPDNTPYSNSMIVELGAKSPGFTRQLLLLPKTQKPAHSAKVSELLHGTPSDLVQVPLNSYSFEGTNLHIKHYIDDRVEDEVVYPIGQLLPAGQDGLTLAQQQEYVKEHSIINRTFYLGTDRYGRDILSRLITGSRVSLSVGFVAVILSLSIGIILGSVAGYFGGKVDSAVMWVINILWSIPTLLLVFAITLTIGKGFWEIFVAIGLTMWVGAARLIRGQVMVLREMEYVTAAKALGISDMRIIFRHILPNIAGPLMVIAASNFAAAILTEAGLSFLGIGVQPPQPSWGLMIKEHYNFLLTNKPFPALIPGFAIMLLVYSFNILGNALRDILDVKG
ncbi:peptide transporter [Flavipsychrobacter stenotrophus]|uniref:Peptide transporter n=1 Tax=Flavipsychrobacter stenotrophus TaxID=2077091 RepID=A0A2S7SW96_9BACT|nr:ABC transporter permease [Flavipsychrobacter stenotrophus]PQJ11200.1 peptide transporter [Flavipsychrobacter stenotrophus]